MYNSEVLGNTLYKTCDVHMYIIKLYNKNIITINLPLKSKPTMFIVYFWGTSIRPTLYICDIFAHPTVYNGHTSDSRTFEKMTVKNATIIKMHYINDIRLYNIYRSFFSYVIILSIH